MTTSISILLTSYLIGYFISFGLVIGIHKEFNFNVFVLAFFCGLLSWINIGVLIADKLIPDSEKIKSTNEQ